MTRTQQTYSIVGAILVAIVALITAYVVIENKKEYDKRYPGCWQLVGENNGCEAHHASRRLRGLPPAPYGMDDPYDDLTTEPLTTEPLTTEPMTSDAGVSNDIESNGL